MGVKRDHGLKQCQWAERNVLDSKDFDLYVKHDKLIWIVQFPAEKYNVNRSYHILEIDWNSNTVIEKYSIYTSIGH